MAEGSDEISEEIEHPCVPCLKNGIRRSAVVFCSECQGFQCKFCADVHGRFDLMKDHLFISVNDVNKAEQGVMKGLDYCHMHYKRYEFFCKKEKVLACSTCVIAVHKKCKKVVKIEQIEDSGKCDQMSNQLKHAMTETKTVIDKLEETNFRVPDDVKDIEMKLANMRIEILKSYDDFARKVTTKAKTLRDAKEAEWGSKKIEYETKIKAISTTMKTLDGIIEHGTTSQRFIATHSMQRSVQNKIKEHNSLREDLKKLLDSLTSTDNFEHFENDLKKKLNPAEIDINNSVQRKSTLKHIAAIDLKQKDDDVGEPLYTGLDFLADGKLVATDNNNSKLVMYDNNLKLLSNFKLPYRNPLCVAVVAGDEIVITGGSRLDLVQVSQSHTMTLNRTVKVNVQYSSISMMDDNEAVVSTYDHDTPVRIVSMSGEEKDIDIAFSSKKYQLGKSSSAYIRGKHKIVLTDMDEDTVFIYEMVSGERIVVKHELIKKPQGVDVGPYDHVFVGSRSAPASIVEMTHTGYVLSSIDVDMKFPHTICISRDRKKLAVSNANPGNKILKIYELSSE